MNWRDKPRVRFLPRAQLYMVTWGGKRIYTPQPALFVSQHADSARWLARQHEEPTPTWAQRMRQMV